MGQNPVPPVNSPIPTTRLTWVVNSPTPNWYHWFRPTAICFFCLSFDLESATPRGHGFLPDLQLRAMRPQRKGNLGVSMFEAAFCCGLKGTPTGTQPHWVSQTRHTYLGVFLSLSVFRGSAIPPCSCWPFGVVSSHNGNNTHFANFQTPCLNPPDTAASLRFPFGFL